MRWDEIVARTAPLAGSPVREGDDLATIIYTSGTTGMPKGVMHSFGDFAWAIDAGLKRMLDRPPTSACSATCRWRTWPSARSWSTGCWPPACTCSSPSGCETFARDLQRARPTIFFSVPRLWVKFQQGVHAQMPPQRLERLLKIPLAGRFVRRKMLKALGLDAMPLRRRRRRADAA